MDKEYNLLLNEIASKILSLDVECNQVKIYVQKYKDFNFACGSRIHGNIMPILMGIPAAICPIDSRTREMAEFFDIPMITEKDLKKKSLYSIYLDTDTRDSTNLLLRNMMSMKIS